MTSTIPSSNHFFLILKSGLYLHFHGPVEMKKCLSVVSVAQTVKNLLAVQETWVRSLVWEDPPEKGMAIHSSIRGSHGQRSLADCSPWGRKESGMTEWLTLPVGWLTALRCLWFTVLGWQWTLNPVGGFRALLCRGPAQPSAPPCPLPCHLALQPAHQF